MGKGLHDDLKGERAGDRQRVICPVFNRGMAGEMLRMETGERTEWDRCVSPGA